MNLLSSIKRSPLLRPCAFPLSPSIALVCYNQALPHIPEAFLSRTHAVYVVDHLESTHNNICIKKNNTVIRIKPLQILSDHISSDVVFFHNEFQPGYLHSSVHILQKIGFNSFAMCMPIPYNDIGRTTHIPGYYYDNKDALESFFKLLESDADRLVLSSRIRAIETGNIGYLKVSDYPQYFHPEVMPVDGDYIIDGGVSGQVHQQVLFSKAVGPSGKIFGFEPDPIGFQEASTLLLERCCHKNYKLIPLGLWKRKGRLRFVLGGQGTHFSQSQNVNAVECSVVSIDEFVESTRLQRVDFIKLDVEGAEIQAILGAVKSIKKYSPKLAISLYHNVHDLFRIPQLLQEINDTYTYHLGHHHGALFETILYAHPR